MKKLFTLFALAFCLSNTKAQIIITAAGNHQQGYSGDGGLAINAELNYPRAIILDALGNIFIADNFNYVIRKINPSGIISTYAGGGTSSADGIPATSAQMNSPQGLALDALGNLYIADGSSRRIRMVNTLGIISTFAGNGTSGYSGDGGQATAASFYNPYGLANDAVGNLYISDLIANVVRKVNTAGIITTIAGTGTYGYSGDGGLATAAEINYPYGIACDAAGSLYIADMGNERIRKVSTSGIISTFAGNGIQNNAGDGGQATLAEIDAPQGVCLDAFGNVYFTNNYNIRQVNTAGIISTYAGLWAAAGYSGDNGPAIASKLRYPNGVACDAFGNLFISDYENHVIREVGNCIPVTPNICMVEVDSLSQNNVIYWQNTYPADTFYIYRDTANYNYALIGKVPASDTSLFVDTVRTLYTQNGDPNASSWRYKIAYADTCGGGRRMSPMSPWHESVFMITNSTGNFSWNFYQIEGENIPVPQVQGYYFEVDSFSTGHYHVVQSLSASSTSYHDTHYASYPHPTWRSTAVGFSCNPSAQRLANGGNNNTYTVRQKSHSNTARQAGQTTGINQLGVNNGQVIVYPNPSNGLLNVYVNNYDNASVEIYNLIGEKIFSQKLQSNTTQLNLSNVANGMYQLKLIKNNATVYQTKISKVD